MEKYFHVLLENTEVADEIRATYKYVFVDEFQDCSPKQVKIFDSLSEIVENIDSNYVVRRNAAFENIQDLFLYFIS